MTDTIARHPKAAALEEIASRALAANPGGAGIIIADATAAFKRMLKRAETLPDEFERVELVQRRGPTIEFTGRLLAETDAPGTDGTAHLEVWETEAGAFIAVREWQAEADNDEIHVLVVERQDDPLAMRLAVMDFFRWHQAARTMAHKQLKWSLKREVA